MGMIMNAEICSKARKGPKLPKDESKGEQVKANEAKVNKAEVKLNKAEVKVNM